MPTYTIQVNNSTTQSQEFILYASAPSGSNDLNFQFPCIQTRTAPGGSQAVFQFTDTMYGVCGTSQIQNGLQIAESDTTPQPIVLGASGQKGTTLAVTYTSGAASFENPEPQGSAGPGSFEVHTTPSFTPADNVYVGYATTDPTGNKVVNVVANVAPATSYPIVPSSSYQISTGSCPPGSIVDPDSIGDPLIIAFGNASGTTATTTFQNDGTYSLPTFS